MGSVLVTGGAGFIGSWFIRCWLRQQDEPVVALDNLSYAGHRSTLADVQATPALGSNLQFVEGDIGDVGLVGHLLAEHEVEAVVNIAAESHVDRSIDQPAPFIRTNVVGTAHLLEASYSYWQKLSSPGQRRFRFLQVSTDEVYGSIPGSGAFCEDSPYRPNSPYAASKAAGDHFVRAYHRTYGFPTVTTHASNNYGPYQFPEKLIPLMILRAVAGQTLPVYGDGQQVRDWMHVEDHCEGLIRALRQGRPGDSYNFGASCERTNLEVVEAVCRAVDQIAPQLPHRPCRNLVTFTEDRPGHDRRYAVDASKAERQLGWSPRRQFSTALVQTVQWYLDHRMWVDTVSAGQPTSRQGQPQNSPTSASD